MYIGGKLNSKVNEDTKDPSLQVSQIDKFSRSKGINIVGKEESTTKLLKHLGFACLEGLKTNLDSCNQDDFLVLAHNDF